MYVSNFYHSVSPSAILRIASFTSDTDSCIELRARLNLSVYSSSTILRTTDTGSTSVFSSLLYDLLSSINFTILCIFNSIYFFLGEKLLKIRSKVVYRFHNFIVRFSIYYPHISYLFGITRTMLGDTSLNGLVGNLISFTSLRHIRSLNFFECSH